MEACKRLQSVYPATFAEHFSSLGDCVSLAAREGGIPDFPIRVGILYPNEPNVFFQFSPETFTLQHAALCGPTVGTASNCIASYVEPQGTTYVTNDPELIDYHIRSAFVRYCCPEQIFDVYLEVPPPD